ncbi:UNVERIFIED_ORG: hypothetical protein EDC92_11760 [Dietzia maris]|jgi:hypothetical protein|uniref:hypothetical protein n=1 Tax=Dietzia maris TaxID=37915 RepID=UPI00104F4DAB
MASRTWQVFADLAAPERDEHLMRVLDAVPGSALIQFEDGSAEVSMLVDAPTSRQALLFAQVLLTLLDLAETGMSAVEAELDAGEYGAPVPLQDPNAVRAQKVASALARRPHVAA